MAKPIIPLYREVLPDGRMLWGLSEYDIGRVRAGFGCGSCLEAFDCYLTNCPTCNLPTRAEIMPEPDHWKPSPPEEDVRWRPQTIDDLVDTDTAVGEVGRWYQKKKR